MIPVLWLCGPSCVGKSTVGWQVHTELGRRLGRTAYLDLAQVGFLRPAPPDDREGHRLKAANLAALWPRFLAAGARCLVLSGPVHDQDTARSYAAALPHASSLTLCRLRADEAVLRERVLLRGRGGGPAIPGDELRGRDPETLRRHADRAAREAAALDRAGLPWTTVDATHGTPAEVAARVLTATGDTTGDWPRSAP
ncbi:AAA family ATPase [Streptomyces hoynatensis]|uniref:Adenylyl-sulfate kinase n=1 Tax=Streptomyces hoynatensis TaxID=1141874 RepID=A0A3A9YLS9_9ACTN|nr:AAA family ATPase [Streptomyces hoynatensis]RKN35166.1 hypothetical protein D7294_30995 [Streptomyces hoynatensis]